MTGEPMTEREAILAARVKELEAAAQAQVVSVAKGGVFEATWHTINAIIPTWLAGSRWRCFSRILALFTT